MLSKGRLIVLEGIDGSGKSSQYRRICARMEKDGIDYNHIVFPRYDKESSALIRMYLSGQFGTHPDDVNAYAASTFYAVDRFASFREDWGKIYNNGGLIISDRYTTSNAVHQGSKLSDEELPAFFRWLSDLEYVKMGLPKPDLVIYLDVDLETSLARMKRRQEKNSTKADIHEKDVDYLRRCLHTADMAAEYYGWKRIPFLKDGAERDMDEKNDEIYNLILSYIQSGQRLPKQPPTCLPTPQQPQSPLLLHSQPQPQPQPMPLPPQPKRMMRMMISQIKRLVQPLQNIKIPFSALIK